MRALTVTEHGRPPSLTTRPDPEPGEGEVLVEVTAAAITPLDLLCATGTSYFGPPALPYVPGVQGVGVVRDGAGDLVGRRVWFPSSAGMAPGDGGLGELALAPADQLVAVEAEVPDTTVAALGLSAVAAWEVLEGRAALRPGERVLVLGAGGVVGQVALQAARILGADRVVGLARSERARATAAEHGADEVVAYADGDEVDALADRLREALGGPADVVVDPLAGVPGSAAARVLAPGARLVNLGGSAGPSLSVDSAALRGTAAAVLGYTNNGLTPQRRAEVLTRVLEQAAAGRIRVRHEVMPLDDGAAAWSRVAAGQADGRVVLVP